MKNNVDIILDHLEEKECCGATFRELKKQTNLPNKRLRNIINRLITLEFIYKVSENKQGVWCQYFIA